MCGTGGSPVNVVKSACELCGGLKARAVTRPPVFDFVLREFLHPQRIVSRSNTAQMRAAEHGMETIDSESTRGVAQNIGKSGVRAAQKHGRAFFGLHQKRDVVGKRVGHDFSGIGALKHMPGADPAGIPLGCRHSKSGHARSDFNDGSIGEKASPASIGTAAGSSFGVCVSKALASDAGSCPHVSVRRQPATRP